MSPQNPSATIETYPISVQISSPVLTKLTQQQTREYLRSIRSPASESYWDFQIHKSRRKAWFCNQFVGEGESELLPFSADCVWTLTLKETKADADAHTLTGTRTASDAEINSTLNRSARALMMLTQLDPQALAASLFQKHSTAWHSSGRLYVHIPAGLVVEGRRLPPTIRWEDIIPDSYSPDGVARPLIHAELSLRVGCVFMEEPEMSVGFPGREHTRALGRCLTSQQRQLLPSRVSLPSIIRTGKANAVQGYLYAKMRQVDHQRTLMQEISAFQAITADARVGDGREEYAQGKSRRDSGYESGYILQQHASDVCE